MDQLCLSFWMSCREEHELILHAEPGWEAEGGSCPNAGTLTLAQLKAERAVTGKAAPQESVSLPSTHIQGLPAGSVQSVCDSISRGSPDCLPSVRLFLARAVPGAAQNRWHRGMSLSSFSHNSRLRERLAKERGRYLCGGEGEGCSESCMIRVKLLERLCHGVLATACSVS